MKTKAKAKAKRMPANKRARGEPVVRGVLAATLAELAVAGYGGLRVEDVAARARVNKTTVYRRWPTKEELVRAALLSMTAERSEAPNTGSLRGDLLAIARVMVELTASPVGQGLARIMFAEGPDSELMAIARSLRESFEALPRSVIRAAEARGDIAPGIDAMVLFDVLGAAIHRAMFMDRRSVDEAMLRRLVDLLLLGALAPHVRDTKPSRSSAAPRRAPRPQAVGAPRPQTVGTPGVSPVDRSAARKGGEIQGRARGKQ